ncbi:MAG TPA: phosphoribosyltransferase family protein [Acidimicrobiia bacterium]
MPPDAVPLLTSEDLARTAARIGREIAVDHPDGVVLVGVLKGALTFLGDLAREVRGVPVFVDFVAISRFAPDSGRVRVLKDVDLDLTDRDVVLVEDMVDTGLTATFLRREMLERGARRVELCTLLDRPTRRIVPLDVRYRGAEIPDVFVLGYGLHLDELYRNLDAVYVVDRRVVQEDPHAYLDTLYGRRPVARPRFEGPGDGVTFQSEEAP